MGAEPPATGTVWRHRVRRTVYVVDCIATGQGGSIDGVPVVVYVGAERDRWCRPLDEFLQRFTQITNAQVRHADR